MLSDLEACSQTAPGAGEWKNRLELVRRRRLKERQWIRAGAGDLKNGLELVRYEAVRGSKPSEAVQKRARWAQEKVGGRSRLAN